MLVRVTCAGIVIGTARFDRPSGLASAALYPSTGYGIAARAAQSLGDQLTHHEFWSPADGDFADVVAARWEGGRLAIQDWAGRELAASSVVVLEAPLGGRSLVQVVADFRGDSAHIGARIYAPGPHDRNRTRPAA